MLREDIREESSVAVLREGSREESRGDVLRKDRRRAVARTYGECWGGKYAAQD